MDILLLPIVDRGFLELVRGVSWVVTVIVFRAVLAIAYPALKRAEPDLVPADGLHDVLNKDHLKAILTKPFSSKNEYDYRRNRGIGEVKRCQRAYLQEVATCFL